MPDHVPQAHGEPGARAELDRLVKRLRLLSPRSWRDHRDLVRDVIGQLVSIAADVHGRDLPVPELPDYVLADAVAVIGHDLMDSSADPAVRARIAVVVDAALRGTR